MTDQNDFDALKGIFENMDPAALKYPTMPMGIYLQEAADLHAWVLADRDALEAAGFDWTLVVELAVRIGAARHAQSIWTSLRFARAEAQREYKNLSPAGYDLRDTMVHHMLFAYRRVSDVLSRVQSIAEGTGDADMLQDLSDLAVLGRTYPKPLAAVKFDVSLFDEAETTCETLSPLLAQATSENAQDNEAKLNRDRAFTYLKEAVDEIREYGRYVFWRNENRAKGYASAYMRRHRRGRKADDDSDPQTDTTTGGLTCSAPLLVCARRPLPPAGRPSTPARSRSSPARRPSTPARIAALPARRCPMVRKKAPKVREKSPMIVQEAPRGLQEVARGLQEGLLPHL